MDRQILINYITGEGPVYIVLLGDYLHIGLNYYGYYGWINGNPYDPVQEAFTLQSAIGVLSSDLQRYDALDIVSKNQVCNRILATWVKYISCQIHLDPKFVFYQLYVTSNLDYFNHYYPPSLYSEPPVEPINTWLAIVGHDNDITTWLASGEHRQQLGFLFDRFVYNHEYDDVLPVIIDDFKCRYWSEEMNQFHGVMNLNLPVTVTLV